MILERCAAMGVDIVCVQEPWYGPIRPIPSASPAGPAERTEGNMLYGTQLHPAWFLVEPRKDARVVCHVSRRLANAVISLDPAINHRDCMLLLVRLEPTHDPVAILNIYNDRDNSAVEYLADHAHSLPVIDIAGGDYNTHSTVWDPAYPPDPMTRTGEVLDLHARLGLRLLSPPGVPTHFPHRANFRPTVIDLVWIPDDRPHELYRIRVAEQERGLSDHAVIHAHIPAGEWSYEGQPSIAPKSEAEGAFIASVRDSVRTLLPTELSLQSTDDLQTAVNTLFACVQDAWSTHATPTVICDKSKLWWNRDCTDARKALNTARERIEILKATAPHLVPAARIAERRAFKRLKSTIRKRRSEHLDERIQYVANEQKRVWDLMAWVGPRAMPMYQSLVHNGQPLRTLPDLWQALDSTFHNAATRPVDPSIIDKIPPLPTRDCPPISRAEITDALRNVSTNSTPGWDHLHWRHLKLLTADDHFLTTLHSIYNAIILLGHWPDQFKRAVSVVIPKPYKDDYTRVKSYRPIVLLSTLGKLLEKVLSERLHYECQRFGILHPNQFGGTKAHSTIDAASCLVTHIRAGWRHGLVTSCLAFDVSQFFPSMNHDLLCRILQRYGFAPTLVNFFRHYLRDRRSCFRWGKATSPWFDLPAVGAGQGSALSPVLTNIYIAPAIHILFPTSITASESTLQFYVDDGLWTVTTKTIADNCRILHTRYHQTVNTLGRIGLVIEDEKNELMHFISTRLSRSQFPLPLELSPSVVIQPSQSWRYLGFRLDPRLTFRAHIAYFAERAVSTVNAMLMLGNSNRGLSPLQRRTLYIACVQPLLTYGAPVWFRSKGAKQLIQPLATAQNRALRWITGAFRTTPVGALHSFAGVMPIHLHCKKLQQRYFLRIHTLPQSHPLRAAFPRVFERPAHAPYIRFYPHTLRPTAEIPLTEAFPHNKPLITEKFDPLDDECQPGMRVRDLFADRITYHLDHPKKKDRDALDAWITTDLLPRIQSAHGDPNALVIFTDGSSFASDPNELLGSAAGYRAYHNGALMRSYSLYTGYAFSYDCELIALSIAIAFTYLKNFHTVHIFSDSETALGSITDTSAGRMAPVDACRILRDWFERHPDNHLHLHYCPSHVGIVENEAVDADVKYKARYPDASDVPRGTPFPISYAYVKSSIKDDAVLKWRQLADDNPRKYWGRYHLRHPAFRRLQHTGSFPLKRLGGRPTLVARFVRCITNHAPTGHYRDRFRQRHHEPTMCVLHSGAPAYHTREHILFRCDYYTRKYRHSSVEELLESMDPFYDIQKFLEDNPSAMSFEDIPDYA